LDNERLALSAALGELRDQLAEVRLLDLLEATGAVFR
jgi:hypothetical protein